MSIEALTIAVNILAEKNQVLLDVNSRLIASKIQLIHQRNHCDLVELKAAHAVQVARMQVENDALRAKLARIAVLVALSTEEVEILKAGYTLPLGC